MYTNGDAATVNYPARYSLKSDADRREDAKQISDLLPSAPSDTYKKEMAKKIACTMLEGTIEDSVLETIYQEIDAAPYIDGTALSVQGDVTAGIVSAATASKARGYVNAEEEVKKAQDEQAKRLKVIADAQAPKTTQGVNDTNPNPGNGNKDASGNNMNPGGGRPQTTGGSG